MASSCGFCPRYESRHERDCCLCESIWDRALPQIMTLPPALEMLQLVLISLHQFHSGCGEARTLPNFNWWIVTWTVFFSADSDLLTSAFFLSSSRSATQVTSLSHFGLIDFRRDWPFGKTRKLAWNKWLCDDWQEIWCVTKAEGRGREQETLKTRKVFMSQIYNQCVKWKSERSFINWKVCESIRLKHDWCHFSF